MCGYGSEVEVVFFFLLSFRHFPPPQFPSSYASLSVLRRPACFHALLISGCLSFSSPATLWLPSYSNHPSKNKRLLSPAYRWWAHLYSCLSHLTTHLRKWRWRQRCRRYSAAQWNRGGGKPYQGNAEVVMSSLSPAEHNRQWRQQPLSAN